MSRVNCICQAGIGNVAKHALAFSLLLLLLPCGCNCTVDAHSFHSLPPSRRDPRVVGLHLACLPMPLAVNNLLIATRSNHQIAPENGPPFSSLNMSDWSLWEARSSVFQRDKSRRKAMQLPDFPHFLGLGHLRVEGGLREEEEECRSHFSAVKKKRKAFFPYQAENGDVPKKKRGNSLYSMFVQKQKLGVLHHQRRGEDEEDLCALSMGGRNPRSKGETIHFAS